MVNTAVQFALASAAAMELAVLRERVRTLTEANGGERNTIPIGGWRLQFLVMGEGRCNSYGEGNTAFGGRLGF